MRYAFVACCARAASDHTAVAPANSVMNSRLLMSDLDFLAPARATPRLIYRTFRLPELSYQVLGPDLNCSESKPAVGADGPKVGHRLVDVRVGSRLCKNSYIERM